MWNVPNSLVGTTSARGMGGTSWCGLGWKPKFWREKRWFWPIIRDREINSSIAPTSPPPHICPSLEEDKWIVCFADTRMRKRESVCFSFILPHPQNPQACMWLSFSLVEMGPLFVGGGVWGRGGGSVAFHLGLGSWKLGHIVMSMLCITYQYGPIVCKLSMNTMRVRMSFFFWTCVHNPWKMLHGDLWWYSRCKSMQLMLWFPNFREFDQNIRCKAKQKIVSWTKRHIALRYAGLEKNDLQSYTNWKYFFRKEEDKVITHHVTTRVNVFIPKLHVVLNFFIKHKEQKNPSHNHICTMNEEENPSSS